MIENALILIGGLILFLSVLVVAEIASKIFKWE
jgi:hypothetical protein